MSNRNVTVEQFSVDVLVDDSRLSVALSIICQFLLQCI